MATVCNFNNALNLSVDVMRDDPVALTIDAGSLRGGLISDGFPPSSRSGSEADLQQARLPATGPTVADSQSLTTASSTWAATNVPTTVTQEAWDAAGVINTDVNAIGDTLRFGTDTSPTGNQPGGPDPVEAAISDFQTQGFLCRPQADITRLTISCSY